MGSGDFGVGRLTWLTDIYYLPSYLPKVGR